MRSNSSTFLARFLSHRDWVGQTSNNLIKRKLILRSWYRSLLDFSLFLLILSTHFSLHAQYFSTGQNPASVKWKQIKTEGFRVVFPEGYESTANYIANTLEYARRLDTVTLTARPKRIPVLVHNFTAVSNAMVAWAPKRMELYTIPPQDTYGQEWFQQLAIHEYRHVIQLTKMDQGLTEILTYLFGEQIAAGVIGLYVPFWFIEGDAVAAETAQSNTGRGRLPSFAMPLRTQFLSEGLYSYDKAVFGSYRNFVPDHYILGYHLVAKSREKFGAELWNHTLDKVARNPYMIVPFSEGIRDKTGLSKTKLYKTVFFELRDEWNNQLEQTSLMDFNDSPKPEKRIFTNYNRPHLTKDQTVVAEKSELDDIARFVEIDSAGNEKLLFTPGYYFQRTLTSAGDLLAWAERSYDIRWQHRSYSVVKIFDRAKGEGRQLTHKTRYFAPALSPEAKQIVAVDVTGDQQYSLVILDCENGRLVKRISTPENYFLTNPRWSNDGSKIVMIMVGNSGKAIALADPILGNVETLMDFTFTDISSPVMHGRKIYFVGAWSGVDNIYQLNLDSGEIFMVTSAPFGVADPQISPDGKTLLFSHYTPEGFSIGQDGIEETILKPLSDIGDQSVKLYESLLNPEIEVLDAEKIPSTPHEEKKYSEWLNLFNFHSWAPVSVDAQNSEVKPSISLLSQNLLSSSFTTLGWEYDPNEQTGKYFLNFRYEGLYPVFEAGVDYGERKGVFTDSTGSIEYSWMETNISTGASVPMRFISGRFTRFVTPMIEFDYTQLDMKPESGLQFRKSNYKTLTYRLYASNYLKMSTHDLSPKWGQWVGINFRNSPFDGDSPGSIVSGEGRLYFPGLFRHHTFNLYTGYQLKSEENQYYSNIIRTTRGFTGIYGKELTTWSVNYAFPFAYADLSLSSLLYVKRMRLNLFYDHTLALSQSSRKTYPSTGFELFADTHIFRFLAPISLGFRLSYLVNSSDLSPEFLFSVNFDYL